MCEYFKYGFSANLYVYAYTICYLLIYFVGGKMITSEKAQLWLGGISQSRSEGNLFDMEAQKSSRKFHITGMRTYNM